jgi:hypothetical protein
MTYALGLDVVLCTGVDVNIINLGCTAVHMPCCGGHHNVVRVVLDWQARIDVHDRWGSTISDQNFP